MPVAAAPESLPDYLPARMLNEFVYCPRLFFYEHVEAVFVHNRETVEGAIRHTRVDGGSGELAAAEELAPEDVIHARSVMLSSDRVGLIAKMDLIEVADGIATPVDYKRGKPFVKADGTLDVVGTDHAPHADQDKDCEWGCASFGMLGLQTALSVVVDAMVSTGALDWAGVADRMSIRPAQIGQLTDQGRPIEVGEPANLVLVDPDATWVVDPEELGSKSRNSPFAGHTLPAQVVLTLLRGKMTYSLQEKVAR